MEKWIDWYGRALGAVSRAAAVLAGLCVLATAFIVTYEIVMRGCSTRRRSGCWRYRRI